MSRSPLHREVMRVLIGEIVAGTLAEGELLPKGEDLAAQFDVSLGVVRECLLGLQERGLVEVRHGHGTIVKAEGEWGRFDPDVLAALLAGSRAADVLGEYLECRRILEVEAAGLAAERATTEAVDGMSGAFQRMRATAERARVNRAAEPHYHEADIGFHRAVVRAAGNPTLGQMTAPIHRALATTFGAVARRQGRFERGLPEHERILEAIAGRDPEGARAAMRDHLLTVEGYLREYAARRPRRTRVPRAVRDV
jgi:GntR family transcriptional repressor for pyruvate dehydrogenase complex